MPDAVDSETGKPYGYGYRASGLLHIRNADVLTALLDDQGNGLLLRDLVQGLLNEALARWTKSGLALPTEYRAELTLTIDAS